MDSHFFIRPAIPEDAPALLEIYAPYVRETAVTFEYSVPSPEDFRERIRTTLDRYPYLLAVEDSQVLGYAYAGPLKSRAAYDWSAETSIYLRRGRTGLGLGRALYETLESLCMAQNIQNLYACIAYPETEDKYLTRNSAEFHTHLGFHLTGEFRRCGYKFGTWYNMVWMEKLLGGHPAKPAPLIPFPALDAERIQTICRSCSASETGTPDRTEKSGGL